MTPREKAMNRVQMYSFTLLDAGLYLDAHPKDREALNAYKKQQTLYAGAVKDYIGRYGPLQQMTGDYQNGWSWIAKPWPWEGAEQ